MYIPNEPNIFTLNKVLGPDFKEIFDNIFSSGLFETEKLLEEFKTKIIDNNEKNLDENKLKLCQSIYEYSLMAIGKNPCKNLVELISNTKNLQKYTRSEVRYKRCLDDINEIVLKTRFPINSHVVAELISSVMERYKYAKFEELNMKQTGLGYMYGATLTALLGRYCHFIKPNEYDKMWFVILFIKHLDDIMFLNTKNIQNEENSKLLGISVINLFLLLKKLELSTNLKDLIKEYTEELNSITNSEDNNE